MASTNEAGSRLRSAGGDLFKTLSERAVESIGDRVTGLTDRLEDVASGKPSAKAALESGKSAAEGESPVKGALKGAASAVKDKIPGLGGKSGKSGGAAKPTKATNIIESIDVGVPVRVAYNQWTQFGEFPSFMKKVENAEAQEDNNLSFNQASTLINKYGDDLKGILGMTSVATPASAEAVTQAGKCGSIAVVGLATPNAMKPYVGSGCVKSVVLWNPVDLGYAAMMVLRAVADGTLQPGATSVKAGKLGELQVINGSEILLGAPYVFTKENIDQFDF